MILWAEPPMFWKLVLFQNAQLKLLYISLAVIYAVEVSPHSTCHAAEVRTLGSFSMCCSEAELNEKKKTSEGI